MSGIFGGGDSSSSATTTTSNIDKRIVVSGGVGVTTDGAVTVQSVDAGIATRALAANEAAVTATLNAAAQQDATNASSFDKVLTIADKLFTGGYKALGDSQAATKDAYSQAVTDKAGALDNKTITIAIVAIAAAWAFAHHR